MTWVPLPRKHIFLVICVPLPGKYISQVNGVYPTQEHISLVTCFPLPRKHISLVIWTHFIRDIIPSGVLPPDLLPGGGPSAPMKYISQVKWVYPTQEHISLVTSNKQLAWPMAELQIGHQKLRWVLSACFPFVIWRSRPVPWTGTSVDDRKARGKD